MHENVTTDEHRVMVLNAFRYLVKYLFYSSELTAFDIHAYLFYTISRFIVHLNAIWLSYIFLVGLQPGWVQIVHRTYNCRGSFEMKVYSLFSSMQRFVVCKAHLCVFIYHRN